MSGCAPSPVPVGDAILQDIINNVQISSPEGQLELARNGTGVGVGMEVKSGDNSLARLAFDAGPTVRFSSNTTFSMATKIAPEEVRLDLEAGRLRLSLFGHRFGVSTPLGLVQLDGFGEVLYQIGASPETGDDELNFRCMSGPCQFQNDLTYLALDNMEALTVMQGGLTVTRTILSELDLRQFIGDNPGSTGLIATLTAAPTHTTTPVPTTTTPTLTPTFPPTATRPPRTATPTITRTRTRAPTRIPTFTPTPSPTLLPELIATGTSVPPPNQPPPPPPAQPTATNPPAPPPDTPVPPPTDTPLPPPPPTKPPDTPTG